MQNIFLFFAFFIFLVFMVAQTGSGLNTSNPNSSSTPLTTPTLSITATEPAPRVGGAQTQISNNPNPAPEFIRQSQKTDEEIAREIESINDEIFELQQDVESAELREPISKYAERIQFTLSTARSTNPELEYLTIRNIGGDAIDISKWYIESVVSDRRAAIPDGIPIYRDTSRISALSNIILKPNQQAFLVTGDSPVDVSFQENICTGYLNENESFTPYLRNACPRALETMERYGNIALDDDSCYDFVERIYGCRAYEEGDPELEDLSRRCENFIDEHINYTGCVKTFGTSVDFYKNASWYIYFERSSELWRLEREILRLVDEDDRIIGVLEY